VLDQYQGKVKLVVKHFPSEDHPYAFMAATAALAANQQKKFWAYHQRLFENFDTLNEGKIQALAFELGLDLDQFKADMKSPSIYGVINRDIENGLVAGVSGVPAIFVNGKKLDEYTLIGIQRTIESELNKNIMALPGSDN
jgi:protein-disulfide isomerase